MDDVRQAAEERAARPKKAPVGSSFESERQREKNARAVKVATPVAAAAGSAAAVVVSSQLIKERTYTHVESSGGHGGRGGFSGGGFSGGGFSGGGGGSVGGGGHSF